MKTKCYAVTVLFFMMVLSIHYCYSQTVICQTPDASINADGEDAFNQYVIKFKKQGKHLNTDLKMIPVVIHVIYRNSADRQQITMARIQSQFDATNKQLRRLNANANETRKIFLPVTADCNIQVCLATRKPDRSSFSGVIYHHYPRYNQLRDLDAIRAATILDPDRYLNVWVTPETDAASAIFPWQRTAISDGFHIGAEVFGTIGSNLSPNQSLGVIFTHELAHCLGVLHTFDYGANFRDRCDLINDPSIQDFCADTPLDWNFVLFNEPCNEGERVCDNDDPGYSFFAQTENYVNYVYDECANMFSKDQRARMRACLYRFRHKLASPFNLKFTGVNCRDLRGDCNDYSTPLVSVADYNDLQVANPVLGKKIIMFPNPTNGIVHITYGDLDVKKGMSIRVYNKVGRMLKELRSHATINELNIGSFPDGVYYMRITVDNSTVTKYIMKTGLQK